MSPVTVSGFSPRFRTVSIIPGMLNAAPERTLTSSGLAASPKPLPVSASRSRMWASTSSQRPGGSSRPAAMYALQAWVVMVKPGGTGSPALVISASPAPLPPRRARISALPSGKV